MMDSQGARARYRRILLTLGIVFSILLAAAWTCYGLTQHFAKGTANYSGALVALASVMTSLTIQYFIVAKYIMVAGYDRENGCCSFYSSVCFLAFYPGAVIAGSIAVIVCSIVFGIRYEQRVPTVDQVNKDANFIMGVVNLVLGVCIDVCACAAIYFGNVLKRDLDRATQNEGAFVSGCQSPKLANY